MIEHLMSCSLSGDQKSWAAGFVMLHFRSLRSHRSPLGAHFSLSLRERAANASSNARSASGNRDICRSVIPKTVKKAVGARFQFRTVVEPPRVKLRCYQAQRPALALSPTVSTRISARTLLYME